MVGRSLSRAPVAVCIILCLVAALLVQPGPALASAPGTPVNQSPSDGAVGVRLTPTLQASGFSDDDGDSHDASRWRIGGHEYESSAQLTSFQVPSGLLDYSTTYSWQVCYTDNAGETSAWSSGWSFTTEAAPLEPPAVTTGVASAVDTTSATLNGDLGGLGTATSVSVSFQWGLTTGYGSTIAVDTMTAAGGFSAGLSGLSPGTAYHFQAVAVGDGTEYGGDRTFTTHALPTAPPEVTTAAADPVGTTNATLHGALASLGTASSVSVSFEWGLTTGYGRTTAAEPMTAAGGFSAGLSSLTPETTYHFRAVAASADGSDSGDDRTFTTGAAPTEPPSVATAAASGIGATAATLNGNLGDLGTAGSVAVSFQWGPTTAYGYATPAQTMDDTGSMSYAVSGLAPETTYHFRAVAQGDGSDLGSDRTFTTVALPDEPPVVTTRAAGAIGTTSATLNLNLSSLGSAASVQVSFEWGPTAGYGSTTAPATVGRTGSFSFALSGLSPETTYHFRARAEGDGEALGGDLSFATSGAPAAPPAVTTLAAGDIGTTSATLNLDLTGLGSAAAVQVSFEWGLTTDYGQSSPAQAMEGAGTLGLPVTGLAAASTYHFRAVAAGDGTAYGSDLTFTTASAPAAPPRVKTVDVQPAGTGSARLGGELTSLGSASSVTVSFVWGTSPGGPYPNETPGTAMAMAGPFHSDLDVLAPGITCYVQARAAGDGVSYGVERSFTTVGLAPRIDSLMAYTGQEGPSVMLKITGANLGSATRVELGEGVRVRGLTVVSDGEIRADVVVDGSAGSGGRQVAVTTPSGTAFYSVPAGFLAGVSGSASDSDGSARASMWIYLVVVGVGLVAALLVVPLEVALWRRHRK